MKILKNILWGSLPILSIWTVFILHEFSGMDISDWYGYPLIVTYTTIVVGAFLTAIWKIVEW